MLEDLLGPHVQEFHGNQGIYQVKAFAHAAVNFSEEDEDADVAGGHNFHHGKEKCHQDDRNDNQPAVGWRLGNFCPRMLRATATKMPMIINDMNRSLLCVCLE